ncbi:hypothetical protein [Phyllobacterium sp. CL33Tsu]|uniref:hypothetical protein n=1 Tax=Phyllobacterium sp. CL33Tsu TaxID=1798191 RepID=UPI0011133B3E|nr:hypothetical protein [Phyllobacterium sp. CL33Tsu]
MRTVLSRVHSDSVQTVKHVSTGWNSFFVKLGKRLKYRNGISACRSSAQFNLDILASLEIDWRIVMAEIGGAVATAPRPLTTLSRFGLKDCFWDVAELDSKAEIKAHCCPSGTGPEAVGPLSGRLGE